MPSATIRLQLFRRSFSKGNATISCGTSSAFDSCRCALPERIIQPRWRSNVRKNDSRAAKTPAGTGD